MSTWTLPRSAEPVQHLRFLLSFPRQRTPSTNEASMKRLGLLLALGGVVAVIERPSAMIPEQVRIETGLLSGVVGIHAADRARVQGHSVCRAAARREPLEGTAAGGEVGRRAEGRRLRRAVRGRRAVRRPRRPWPRRAGAAAAESGTGHAGHRAAAARARARRGLSLRQRLDQRHVGQRQAAGDGVDLRRRLHRRLGRPDLV